MVEEKSVTELKGEAYDLIAQIEDARAKLMELNIEINKKISMALNQPVVPKEVPNA